ncbi:rhomboid family intramembrane serine protease [Gardnerella sp. 2492-Sm]|uniref:rhomboid family intramembrane serine protease n=1 Tax=unclassified Gardnerella TaxID=2628112 RepID=UPI003D044442
MSNLNVKAIFTNIRRNCKYATALIVYACVIIWAVEMVLRVISLEAYSSFIGETAFIPFYALKTPWTWFTSMFVHAPNFTHIFFNMLCLWMLGSELERFFGKLKFFGLYILSGFGGNVASVIWCTITNNWESASYGASGAIMGLIGSLAIAQWRLGEEMRGTIVWILLTLAMPLIIPNIAWQAHVGGLVVGTLMGLLLAVQNPLLRKASFNTRFLVYFVSLFVILSACSIFCLTLPVSQITSL